MRLAQVTFVVALLGVTRGADAQSTPPGLREVPVNMSFVVQTVPLHHLTSLEAVRLLSPTSNRLAAVCSKCRPTFAR